MSTSVPPSLRNVAVNSVVFGTAWSDSDPYAEIPRDCGVTSTEAIDKKIDEMITKDLSEYLFDPSWLKRRAPRTALYFGPVSHRIRVSRALRTLGY